MPRTIYVDLPVTDVARSTAFYEALGFTKNAAFSNEQASAMVWSDAISVMLLDHTFYATFTDKPIADTRATSAVLNCLSFEDRAAVDAFHAAAKKSGRCGTARHRRSGLSVRRRDRGPRRSHLGNDVDGQGLDPAHGRLIYTLKEFAP